MKPIRLRRLWIILVVLIGASIFLDYKYSGRTESFYRRYTWYAVDLPRDTRRESIRLLTSPNEDIATSEFLVERGNGATSGVTCMMQELERSSCRWIIEDAFHRRHPQSRWLPAVSLVRMKGKGALEWLGPECLAARAAYGCTDYTSARQRSDGMNRTYGCFIEALVESVTGIPCGMDKEWHAYASDGDFAKWSASGIRYMDALDRWMRTNDLSSLDVPAGLRDVLTAKTEAEYVEKYSIYSQSCAGGRSGGR